MTGVVLLLILLIIIGVIFFLIRAFTQRSSNQVKNLFPTQSVAPVSTATPSTSAATAPVPALDTRVYNGAGFSFQYPKNWGILTCNNSQNIELDPTSGKDQLNVACHIATKPITLIVGSKLGCGGKNVTLGRIQVSRTKTQTPTWIQYSWCTKTNPILNITHRVSKANLPANSPVDYSIKVEQIIASLRFASGS